VHITEESTAKILWQQGFFGKGSLSRSEPTWLNREKRRRGLLTKVTSEEITKKRREERKEFKNERARKERETIEQRLKKEGKIPAAANDAKNAQGIRVLENGHVNGTAVMSGNRSGPETTLEDLLASAEASAKSTCERLGTDLNGKSKNGAEAPNKTIRFSSDFELSQPSKAEPTPSLLPHGNEQNEVEVIENKEHLQLTLEEAFFLAYGLGVLDVVDLETHVKSPLNLCHCVANGCTDHYSHTFTSSSLPPLLILSSDTDTYPPT
jgi:tRNA-splicing endonuclease subunit Sen2